MIYACADLHGIPLQNLLDLLEKVKFSDNDYLYVIGDVIDRGEHGIEILSWLLNQPNAQLILGNHEAMMLVCEFIFDEITEESVWSLSYDKLKLLSGWMNNGGEVTLNALRRVKNNSPETISDIMEYLKEAPLYETVSAGGKDFILVHGGFDSFERSRKLSSYSADELLWHRTEKKEKYFKDIITVCGHTPTEYYGKKYEGKIYKTDTWINIDTGDRLSLLRLDDLKEFYI